MGEEDRRARARERFRTMRLVKTRLGEGEHDFSPVRGEEALSLVNALTTESWAAAGRKVPRYSRGETPYRFVRGWPE